MVSDFLACLDGFYMCGRHYFGIYFFIPALNFLTDFLFWAVLSNTFDALYAGQVFALHGIGQQPTKPQKVTWNRASAARCRESRNDVIYIRKR